MGRRGRIFLRRAAHARRRSHSDESAFDGGIDSVVSRSRLSSRICSSACPAFKRRLDWFIAPTARTLRERGLHATRAGSGERRLLSIIDRDQLQRILQMHARRRGIPVTLRHSGAFASPSGAILTRSAIEDTEHSRGLRTRESSTGLFGGNSNWRAHLVSGELPAHRVAAAIPSILRRWI